MADAVDSKSTVVSTWGFESLLRHQLDAALRFYLRAVFPVFVILGAWQLMQIIVVRTDNTFGDQISIAERLYFNKG